ncbi:ABC transporter permease [Leptospira selangorensis]|uniref:ABC transporter permease n=1 Tax=Leptospira selangorensis TaxID=2484982 RepID=A0A5F2C2Q5_9LEPT|nr:ABC transporter permease [Leptospira selangorensis]TGM17080.1 ABC transporter permease [Leptospira selangorensis]TGM21418.1 ABC transporter permease [Leptospira selangorensis]
MNLYFLFLYEYFKTHLPRFIFALLGISLGVGLFLSTTSNANKAERSLIDFSMGYLKGDFNLKISPTRPGQSLDWQILSEIQSHSELRNILAVRPRIQQEGISSDNLRVLYMGMDLTKEYLGIPLKEDTGSESSGPLEKTYVSKSLAEKFKGRPFSLLLNGKNWEFKDYIPVDMEGGFLIIEDISLIQEKLDSINGADYLLLKSSGSDLSQTKESLQRILGSNVKIETSEEIQEKSANALRSFQLNLLIISFISLLIAFFMVSNTMTGLYLSRERELGILRTLGLDVKSSIFLFLSQSVLLGSIGTVLGIVFGIFFSGLDFFRPESGLVDKNLLSTYSSISLSDLGLAAGLGILGSIISSVYPAIRAGKVPPLSILRDSEKEKRKIPNSRLAIYGGIIFFASLGISNLPSPWKLPLPGLLGVGGVTIGITFAFPYLLSLFSSGVSKILDRSDKSFPFFRIGLEELKENPGRNTLTAATVMLAVSLVLCLTILTDSYKKSLNDWVDSEYPSDFTIINDRFFHSGIHGGVPKDLPEKIRELGLSSYLDGFLVNTSFDTDKGNFIIHAYDFSVYRDKPERIENEVKEETDVLISSNMAHLKKLKVGDILVAQTPFGKKNFHIKGIKEHFFSEKGTVMMDVRSYEKNFEFKTLNSIKLFLKKEYSDVSGIEYSKKKITDFLKSDPEYKDLILLDSAQLREIYLYEINKVFRVLDSLKATAILISVISLLSSLVHTLYDKRRILGLLKYLGASQDQLGIILKTESVYLTGFGAFFGIISSLIMSPIILYVVNKNAFGWTLTFSFLPETPILILIFAPILGWISAIYPLRLLRKMSFQLSPE